MEEGWFQQKLADSAYETFKKIDSGEKISVGVNRYVDEQATATKVEIHPYDEQCTQLQIERLNNVRAKRDTQLVQKLLEGAAGAGAQQRREPAAEDDRARQSPRDAWARFAARSAKCGALTKNR